MSTETWTFWSPVALLAALLWVVLSVPPARGRTRALAAALRLTLVLGLIGYTILLWRAGDTLEAYAVVFLVLPGWGLLSIGTLAVVLLRWRDRRRASADDRARTSDVEEQVG